MQWIELYQSMSGKKINRSREEEIEFRDRERRTLYLNSMELLPYNLEQFISEHGVNLKFGNLEPQLWTFYF